MTKKLMINHFVSNPNFSNGVTNYIKEVNNQVGKKYEVLEKPYSMGMVEFRTYVYNKLKDKSNVYEVIECAESQSPCLFLPNTFNVHVRMHCPFYLFKKVIHEEPSESRFSDEVRAMYKAKAISSPSHGMLDLLSDELDIAKIHVYKNPVKKRLDLYKKKSDKNIDVLFFGRFNKLKGNEYLEPLISRLPKDLRIVIAGKQEHQIEFKVSYPNVELIEHIEGDDKFELLSNAKVMVSLSKFENCSMAILESLSVGTPVVAWDVGGNAELAPPGIISVAQLGDIEQLASYVHKYVKGDQVKKNDFEKVINLINEDFIKGSTHVLEFIKNNTREIYKGLSFKKEHENVDYYPEIIQNSDLKAKVGVPINILLVTSTLATARFFHNLYKDKSLGVNIKVAYQGPYYSQIKGICDFNLDQRMDNIKHLHDLVKKQKIKNVIFDISYPIFLNDIYKLAQIEGLKVAYADNSIVNGGSYFLDRNGFKKKSMVYSQRLKAPSKQIKVNYGDILIRGNSTANSIELDKILEILSHTQSGNGEIDFASNNEHLLEVLSDKSGYTLNLVSESKVDIGRYKIVISLNDLGLVKFFDFKNAIFIANKTSVFLNKNIDSNSFSSGFINVDVNSRDITRKYLLSRDIVGNSSLIREVFSQ